MQDTCFFLIHLNTKVEREIVKKEREKEREKKERENKKTKIFTVLKIYEKSNVEGRV